MSQTFAVTGDSNCSITFVCHIALVQVGILVWVNSDIPRHRESRTETGMSKDLICCYLTMGESRLTFRSQLLSGCSIVSTALGHATEDPACHLLTLLGKSAVSVNCHRHRELWWTNTRGKWRRFPVESFLIFLHDGSGDELQRAFPTIAS